MKYAFKTYQMKVDDHVFWCVESEVLDGCVAQGDTLEEALSEFAENENDELVDVIKEFALENLYKCAEEFSDKKYNCWMESKYHLHFEYIYDENEPYMELKYIPVSW